MKFIPILFSTPMVQAILDDRKTMTRRKVKEPALTWLGPDLFNPEFVALRENHLCPYGSPGDVLWVRESWKPENMISHGEYAKGVRYAANGSWIANDSEDVRKAWLKIKKDGWKPSIHMPKAACRIFLEVTDVRVERLQEITKADIYSEGAITEEWQVWREDVQTIGMPAGSHIENERDVWTNLWDMINGEKHPFESNPWVWVVSFKRIDKPENF